MAAKETVGKSNLCIIFANSWPNSQSFLILYILEGMDSEDAKKINKKATGNVYEDNKIYIFSRFSNALID